MATLLISALRPVFFGFLVVAISACGFALRGTNQAALTFDEMAIIQPPGYYPLAESLAEAFRANNVTVPEPPVANQGYALALSPETLEQRTITVNTRAGAGQYELIISVDATLYLNGELIGGPETITTRGSFYEDTANISGSNSARDLALEAMRRRMAEQILRRLQSLNL
jgi:outer membrane lipopolysaccharide assembly protein LptE/RlpB